MVANGNMLTLTAPLRTTPLHSHENDSTKQNKNDRRMLSNFVFLPRYNFFLFAFTHAQ